MASFFCSLTTLIPNVKDVQIKAIIKELCQNMMVKKKGAEQLRDVSIMGMGKKSVVRVARCTLLID